MRIFHVDAFTAEPFRGNPAAVCLVDEPRDERWMQAVAAEMNLSETAFVDVAGASPGAALPLRWFTPAVEADLCGHATLATAHALWEVGVAGDDEHLRFTTRSGLLSARRTDAGIQLDFPAARAVAVDPPPDGLAEALGVTLVSVGQNRLDYVVEVPDAATVRGLRPDLAAVARLPVRGVVVTAPSDVEGYDFVSRFFTPATGIDEDPVTGSAHCALAPLWADRLGRDRLVGYQASPRGGTVGVELVRDGDRVLLLGQAVTVLRGDLSA